MCVFCNNEIDDLMSWLAENNVVTLREPRQRLVAAYARLVDLKSTYVVVEKLVHSLEALYSLSASASPMTTAGGLNARFDQPVQRLHTGTLPAQWGDAIQSVIPKKKRHYAVLL